MSRPELAAELVRLKVDVMVPWFTPAAIIPRLPLGPQFAAIEAMAPAVGVEVTPIGVHDAREIERGIGAIARMPNAGLVVTGSSLIVAHRHLIIALAAQHKPPAIYYERFPVDGGGLFSYGPSFLDQYRLAAGYVDRILRGEKSANLPVQAPTKHELVINVRTAKALGITVPPDLLAR
jgi:putative ABC transport system substrate-binding protein